MTSKIQHISDEELNKVIPLLIEFERAIAIMIAGGTYREEFNAINRWSKKLSMSDKCLILMKIKFTKMWNKGLRPDKDLQARFDAIRKEKGIK